MRADNQTRVQIRASKDEKAFFERAAHRCGFKTLSEFMRVSALEKAKRDLKEFPNHNYEAYETPAEPTELTATDSAIFSDSISNPKEPNELLKALFSKDNEEILKDLLVQNKTK